MILYACSSNAGKLREFAEAAHVLPALDLTIASLPGLVQIPAPGETGSTFEQNATAKALYYSQFTAELVFADDSGLCVDALGGAPGIYSARYAGAQATAEENNALLLSQLQPHQRDRHARFVCVIALARAGRSIAISRGEVEGEILRAPRGEDGFGYDPLFFYPPLQATLAELTPPVKFSISHRGAAVRALLGRLQDLA